MTTDNTSSNNGSKNAARERLVKPVNAVQQPLEAAEAFVADEQVASQLAQSSVDAQRSALNNKNIPLAQRQGLARHIGNNGGNRHLNRVLRSPAPDTLSLEETAIEEEAPTAQRKGLNFAPPAAPSGGDGSSGEGAPVKRKSRLPWVQAKLQVGPVNDVYEQEADRKADEVVSRSSLPAQRSALTPLTPVTQRAPASAGDVADDGSFEADSNVETRMHNRKGGGSPLPDVLRQELEPHYGADFSSVRIHTDGESADLNQDLQAQAFTHGNDIFFGSGKYNPGSAEGKHLIAHELTHVVQQGAAASRKPDVQREEMSLEDAVAEAKEEVTEEDVAKQDVKVEPAAAASVPTDNKTEDAGGSVDAAPAAAAAAPAAAPAAAEAKTPEVADAGAAKPADAVATPAPAEAVAPAAAPPAAAVAALPASAMAALTAGGTAAPAETKTAGPGLAEAAAAMPAPSAPAGAKADETPAVGMAEAKTEEGTPPAAEIKAPESAPGTSAGPEAKSEASPAAGMAEAKTEKDEAQSAPGAEAKTAELESGKPGQTLAAIATPENAPAAVPGAEAKTEAPAAGSMVAEAKDTPAQAEGSKAAEAGAILPEEEKVPLQRMAAGGVIQRFKAPRSPEEDPAFQAVVAKSKAAAQVEKQHEPAAAESAKAQAAADPKGSDVDMAAQGRQVNEMQQQPTSGFNAEAFKAKLLSNIESAAPKNLKEAEDFKSNNRIDQVKQSVVGDVKSQKQEAEQKLEDKAEAQPDKSGLEGKDVKPLAQQAAGPAPADIGASQAAPKQKGAEEVEAPIQQQSAELDKQMADAQITEEQLQKSNEPSFQKALDGKKTAQQNAEEAPDQYRKQEQATLTQAQSDAKSTADAKAQDTRSERQKLMDEVFAAKGDTKGVDEGKRQEVAGNISDIYLETKKSVEDILSKMDGEVDSRFNEGAKQAQEAFEKSVADDTWDYKVDRYLSRLDGLILWGRDLFMGLPEDANYIYTNGRNVYLSKMDTCLTGIAQYVAEQLNAAKARIAEGQKQIQTYVSSLSPELQKIGVEAADQIQGKFSELEGTVDSKQDELIQSLTQKYNEKLQEIDARIEEMKLANSGLVNMAMKAIGDVIETIKKLADMLMQTLKNAAGAVQKILDDPITFLSNLLEAVKQGFMQFVGNIGKYLQEGLIDWLVGSLGSAGIKLPKALDDLPGIFNMVLDILGLTYQNIRTKVVEALGPQGEEIVGALEKAWEIFKIIQEKGLAGLWEYIQGMIGDLKNMVMDQIKDMLIGQVIEAGVKWLVSLLGGPAGAFIKAVEGIVNVVTWFINNGERIMGIVNGIISSITSIANGDISGAANFIESVLAKSVPTMISFLADLLGLGGIAEKVQGIIKKIQEPINKAINWVVQKALAMGKAIMGKLKGGKKGGEEGEEGGDKRTLEEKQKDLDNALGDADALLQDDKLTAEEVDSRLPAIKSKYNMKSLKLVPVSDDGDKQTVEVEGMINPSGKTPQRQKYKNLQELTDAEMPDSYKNKYYGPEHFGPGNPFPKGLRFDAQGFPDFSEYAIANVKIKMNGNRSYTEPDGDFWQANIAAGYEGDEQHPDHTWHHHQDRTTMLLVPKAIHAKSHRGGCWVIQHLGAL